MANEGCDKCGEDAVRNTESYTSIIENLRRDVDFQLSKNTELREQNTELRSEINSLRAELSAKEAELRDEKAARNTTTALIEKYKGMNQMLLEKLRKKRLKIASLQKKLCEMILKEAERGEGAEEG